MCDTLLGDAEHIYDINLTDDQLILGIKGTLSVMESSGLKSRLFQGQEHKAKRGELSKLVAPGYLCIDGKSLVKDPNGRVQEAIALVFAKFRELWSVRQVFKWFHEEGIELPVNKSIHGKVQLVWQLPTYYAVKYILQNPVYAGAYVYGQRHTTLALGDRNSVRKKHMRQRYDQARVFLPEQVAYLAAAANVSRPLQNHMRGINQPVINPRIRSFWTSCHPGNRS